MIGNGSTPQKPETYAGNFLFSDPSPSRDSKKKVIEKTPKEELSFDEDFFQAFPDVRLGNDFMGAALTHIIKLDRFSAAAIMIDNTSDKGSQSIYAAHAIDTICKKYDGIWGRLDKVLFGCFFPHMSSKSSMNAARAIQNEFKGSKSLSFGIASYPTANFDKRQIMDNACKALDHAGFLGPSSIVPFDAVSLNIHADKLYQQGDIKGAVAELSLARSLDPCDANIVNSLGVCFGMMDETKKAFEMFETASWLDPEEMMPVYNTGYAHLLENNIDAALDWFLEANAIDPDVFEVVFQLGTIFMNRKQYKKARPFLEKAVELNAKSIPVHRSLGQCYQETGMAREAVNAYKTAVKANPNDSASLSGLGILYDQLGENNEIASIFCKQSIEISPDNGLYRQRLGRVLMSAGSIEKAVEQFESAEALGCDCSEYYSLIPDTKAAKAS